MTSLRFRNARATLAQPAVSVVERCDGTLLSVGLTSVPSHLSTTETAGWASVALAFLNLSEVITRN